MQKDPQFFFRCVDKDEILKEILNLDASKAGQDLDIPSPTIKESADIFIDILHSSFNNSIDQSEFPSILKLANIAPVFKKSNRNSKENYTPVSILSKISKTFERCMLLFRQFPVLWIPIYKSNNVGLEKLTAHSIACW